MKKTSARKNQQTSRFSERLENPVEKIEWPYGMWIAIGLAIVLTLIIFSKYIFGNSYYLFYDIGSDSIIFFYPIHVHVARYIATEGFPMWSFSEGMGQSILSSSLMNPFYWIVYLSDNQASAIIWMEFTKIILTSVVVYRLIAYWTKSTLVNITGTLLYCFSGFVIIGSGWYQFSTEAFLIALLLLSFEQLYQNNKWILFPLTIALICIYQPFDIYLFGVFLIIYFLFRHFTSDQPTNRKLIFITLKMAGLGALGVLISSMIFVSNILLLTESPRVGQGYGYFDDLMTRSWFFLENGLFYTTSILRFFSNDLLGNPTNFMGWKNYLEAPMWYIGLFPLLLLPQVFLYSTRRNRIAWAILLGLFIIPVVFPFFRNAFWLFSGDYFRGFSFFVALVFLMAGLQSLESVDRGKKMNIYLFGITLVVLLLFLYLPFDKEAASHINKDIRAMVRNMLIVYTALIFLFQYRKYRWPVRILFMVAVCIELVYSGVQGTGHRIEFTRSDFRKKVAYNDYSVEALRYIREREKPFYRIVKKYFSIPKPHSSVNDAKVQGYFGTPCYQSFNQKYYIRFQEEMGIIEKGNEFQSRWSMGIMNHPVLWVLASTKYFLSKYPPEDYQQRFQPFFPDKKFGDVWVYRNSAFLPLGFVYSKYMTEEMFFRLSSFQKERYLLKAAAIQARDSAALTGLQQILPGDTGVLFTMEEYYQDVSALQQDTMQLIAFSENHIKGKISLEKPGLLFFSIPFDQGWKATINSAEIKPILSNFGFLGYYLHPGEHLIDLQYTPPFFHLSIIASITGILIYLFLIFLPAIRKKTARHG